MIETAPDAFKRLLRDVVAPELRRQGLKGSGQAYILPDGVYWAQVGFQKSTSSNRDLVKFTINLKVTNKEWWDQQRRDHSPVKDTPPPGVDRKSWDALRLERSAYPPRPSANTFGEGREERSSHPGYPSEALVVPHARRRRSRRGGRPAGADHLRAPLASSRDPRHRRELVRRDVSAPAVRAYRANRMCRFRTLAALTRDCRDDVP